MYSAMRCLIKTFMDALRGLLVTPFSKILLRCWEVFDDRRNGSWILRGIRLLFTNDLKFEISSEILLRFFRGFLVVLILKVRVVGLSNIRQDPFRGLQNSVPFFLMNTLRMSFLDFKRLLIVFFGGDSREIPQAKCSRSTLKFPQWKWAKEPLKWR